MGSKRLGVAPNVPTLSELGIQGFENTPFYGVFAPKSMPSQIGDSLSLAIKDVLNQPKFSKAFASTGLEINWSSAKQFSNEILKYNQGWQKIFQESRVDQTL